MIKAMKTKTKKRIIYITGCLLAAMLLCSCGRVEFGTLTAGGTDPDSLKTNLVKIENQTEDGMLITGTGFFTESGALVTTSNVVDVPGTITVVYSNGSTSGAKLVSNDIETNTAILKAEDPQVDAVAFSDAVYEESSESISLQVFSYQDGEDSAEAVPVSADKVESADGTELFVLTPGLPQNYNGALVVDEQSNVVGQVTLASNRLDYALASPVEELSVTVEELTASQKKNTFASDVRSNVYTNYVETTSGRNTNDLYLSDNYLLATATSESGVIFWVDQENNGLVSLKYNSESSVGDLLFGMSDGSQPYAVATTGNAELSFPLSRILISAGTSGEIPLYFGDISEAIQKITLNGVSAQGGEALTLEFFNQAVGLDLKSRLENDPDFMTFVEDFWGTYSFGGNNAVYYLEDLTMMPEYYPGGMYFLDENGKSQFATQGVSEEYFHWVVQNIYNISDNDYNLFLSEMTDSYNRSGKRNSQTHYGYHDGILGIYTATDYGALVAKWLGIEQAEQDGNLVVLDLYGTYLFIPLLANIDPNYHYGDYYYGMPEEAIPPQFLLRVRAVMEKKTIDGKQYWTLHLITKN